MLDEHLTNYVAGAFCFLIVYFIFVLVGARISATDVRGGAGIGEVSPAVKYEYER